MAPREPLGSSSTPSTRPSLGTLLGGFTPVVVAVLAFALAVPRAVAPDDVPLPVLDARAVQRERDADHARAEAARRTPLPPEVREVGSALRALNVERAKNEGIELALHKQKAALDDAVSRAFKLYGPEPLIALRAVQLERFLELVAAFEATGKSADELEALAGTFVPRMRVAGWVHEDARGSRVVVLSDPERRAAFKMMWNAAISAEGIRELALSLDEQRALYALYIAHPHPSESAARALDAARASARDAATCAALLAGERIESERWRADKIRRFAAIEPGYPFAFALGIANYRQGSFGAAAENFRDWLARNPTGPYTLRARNYLKASIDADQLSP